jgi:hypothetical protein
MSTPLQGDWRAYALLLEQTIKRTAAMDKNAMSIVEVSNMLERWRKKCGIKE